KSYFSSGDNDKYYEDNHIRGDNGNLFEDKSYYCSGDNEKSYEATGCISCNDDKDTFQPNNIEQQSLSTKSSSDSTTSLSS
ncbi:hypothetical protein MHBO_004526, partial [Bonamia ostreae]